MTDTPALYWSGSYTADMGGTASGIGVLRSREDGTLEYVGVAVEADSPSFLARNPADARILYAVGEANGRVEAFLRGDSGALTALGGAATGGAGPCHVSIRPDAAAALVSCYGDGSLRVLPLDATGAVGGLGQSLAGEGNGPHESQDGPHAHSTLVFEDGMVLSADLGADRVHVHTTDAATGLLERVGSLAFAGGTGPRHLRRHPSGHVYLVTEHSREVFVLARDGAAVRIVSSTPIAADDVAGDTAAELSITEDGRFVHVGLRGSNRLATLAVTDGGATLTPTEIASCGGNWPRHHVVDGSLLHVANQLSSTVTTFRIDDRTGMLTQLGLAEPVPSPTFLLRA
ncbi:lactonase family protein [Planctomonas psychrotolerans]|uniref:lactonase family protein n=1 Tax=Planctomonas psychrotolerans TaxID=2528712 RepID=UPI00123AD4E7|nr:beta-propeller fold lactonase family protein [Planctomonas psychrotolerans]